MYEHPHAAAAYELIHMARGKDYGAEAERLLSYIRSRDPAAQSVLDVACGTGLHLAAFARLGLDVTGVEQSLAMLEVAEARVPDAVLQQGDMRTFDLGRRYSAVVCLFSAIGYMTTVDDLRKAVARMADHAEDVLVIEPWFGPGDWKPSTLHADCAGSDELVVARVNRSGRVGDVSTIDMRYVIATVDGTETFDEHHRMGLFDTAEYQRAIEDAGLTFEHDREGLIGRGLLFGTRPREPVRLRARAQVSRALR